MDASAVDAYDRRKTAEPKQPNQLHNKELEPNVPCGSPQPSKENIPTNHKHSCTTKQDKTDEDKPSLQTSTPKSASRAGIKTPTTKTKTPSNSGKSKSKKSPFHQNNKKNMIKKRATKSPTVSTDRTQDSSEHHIDQCVDNVVEEVRTPGGDSVSAFFNNDDFEDDPGAILAARMGQNTFGYMGAFPVQEGRVSPERSKVIQEILKNFNLERVMSRYRGNTMYSSYCDSLKNTYFREWLENIMGRERAPFDDQRWNERLMKKVMADMERRLEENERKLEEAEHRRVLKLKLMGIDNGDDWEEEEKKRHVHRPHKKTAAEKEFEKRNKLARELTFRPSEDIETQMEILHRDESQVKKRNSNSDDQASEDVDESQSPAEDDGKEEQDIQEEAEEENQGGESNAVRERREVKKHLRRLFEEEDLRLLYKEAESLIRVTQPGTKASKK